ncbi:hypothetical protein KAI92_04185, partial [Candidatus Parcubacteria bacterium]|nr:hypothetical protein [Candidatus Parcubacteria bacterium]
ISNEQIYSLLGFRSNCVMVPDWNQIIEIPLHEKVIYESRIKKSILPSQNNYSSGDLIAYQVIPKVGPISCISMAINSTTIYLFGDDNKFHPIQNEQVYFDLGYKYDWSDVVEISQELFDYYGEGDVVYGYDNNLGNLCSAEIPSTLIFMSSVQQSELVLEPLPETDDNINITSSNDYTINRSTICKDADMDYPYLPINETTSFTINNSSETSVHAWIQLDNISKRIRIDWYWYDADGRKVESDYAFLGKDGSLYNWWRVFCNCSVYNTKSFGKWKVQIYIEEELAIIDYFYVSVNLAIPQNLNLSYNKELKQVNLTWNQVEFAEKYHIYRNGNMIQETNNLYHTDTEVVLGNSYTYKVLAIRGNRTSSFSDGVNINIPKEELLIPVIIEISVQ